ALQAVGDLPGRDRRGPARRIPGLLALRHGLACHERRRGPAPAPPGDRQPADDHLFDAADRPHEQYTLEVRESNGGAIALYERFGFRGAGHRRAYYHDNREDALIMWRTVPAERVATV